MSLIPTSEMIPRYKKGYLGELIQQHQFKIRQVEYIYKKLPY